MSSIEVYIGLGSNLQRPHQQIKRALLALSQINKTQLSAQSSFYLSAPMGPNDQDDYINAVAKLTTHLSPLELLDQLQRIEIQQGRKRKQIRWSARTIDLDLLLYGQQHIKLERLEVPHYGITERAFVVLPLLEIAPEIHLPDFGPLAPLVEKLASQEITRL